MLDSKPRSPLPREEIETKAQRLVQSAQDTLRNSKAETTHSTYRIWWQKFLAFAQEMDVEPAPASEGTVIAFAQHLHDDQKLKASSIRVAISAIKDYHESAQLQSPTTAPAVKAQLSAIRREQAMDKERQGTKKARPLTIAELKLMVCDCSKHDRPGTEDIRGLRDRALLSLGLFSGLRSKELATLTRDQLELCTSGEFIGVKIHLGATKTDQEGKGSLVAVAATSDRYICPLRLVESWMNASASVQGPLFVRIRKGGDIPTAAKALSTRAVRDVLRQRAVNAGIDPERLSTHSMRRGIAHAVLQAGRDIQTVKRHLRHKSIATTTNYLDEIEPTMDPATKGIA